MSGWSLICPGWGLQVYMHRDQLRLIVEHVPCMMFNAYRGQEIQLINTNDGHIGL